jgi:hypothetical protein
VGGPEGGTSGGEAASDMTDGAEGPVFFVLDLKKTGPSATPVSPLAAAPRL